MAVNKFKYDANNIHAKYGTKSHAAVGFIFLNKINVSKTMNISNNNQKNASQNKPNLKKNIGQKKLTTSETA